LFPHSKIWLYMFCTTNLDLFISFTF
jgi:hypothetical protein